MKKIALLLITALAFATTAHAASSCYQYVELGDQAKSEPYPEYFGAGNEYYKAADCYLSRGDSEKANKYYLKSADYFKKASSYLVEGGDYYQSGLSYERAGEAYERLGKTDKAINNYEKAHELYKVGEHSQKAEKIDTILASLKQRKKTPLGGTAEASYRSIIGLVSLAALFSSAALLLVIAAANFPWKRKSTGHSGNTGTPIQKEPEPPKKPKKNLKEINEETNTKETPNRGKSKKSAEERVIEKLRNKYKPR